RTRGGLRPESDPLALLPATGPCLRTARPQRRPARAGAPRGGTDAVVRSGVLALARPGAPKPDRARGSLDDRPAARPAARGVRPLRAALHRLGRGAPLRRSAPGAHAPAARSRASGGL